MIERYLQKIENNEFDYSKINKEFLLLLSKLSYIKGKEDCQKELESIVSDLQFELDKKLEQWKNSK